MTVTLYRNARLIDGVSLQPRDKVNFTVEDGRFHTISTDPISVSSDAPVVDLGGMTVLPGLFDCHAHLAWDARHDIQLQSQGDSTAQGAMKCTVNMRRFLETGVTTIRDLGVHWLGVESRNAVLSGTVPGPRILASGPPITTTGGHCWWCGVEADGPDGIRQMVRHLAKEGVDLVKVIATQGSLGSFLFAGSAATPNPSFTMTELTALVDEAHNLGRKVTAHATTPEGAWQAVKAGVDGIEHGTDFDEATIALMLEQGTFVIPTFSAYWMQAYFGHLVGIPEHEIERRRSMLQGSDRTQGVVRAAKAGVRIAVGTDQGSPVTPPAALINEMNLHFKYGVSDDPMTVIRNATRSSAELCGIADHVGSIEPGKMADFIVVRQDPLQDLENLYSPHQVYQAGQQVVQDGALVPERPFFFS